MQDSAPPTACTGRALDTATAHAAPAAITLFGSWSCPFVQRVWIALEHLHIPYQYHEVDPYEKPQDLLAVSPRGLVPALRFNNHDPPKALNESTVILGYIEELSAMKDPGGKHGLLPPLSDPYARALARLQSDHVSRTLIPAFYRYLQAQAEPDQTTHGQAFLDALEQLAELFDKHRDAQPGLWAGNDALGWADVMVAPWLFRATNVLAHYRGFALPPSAIKLKAYLDRLLKHPAVLKTCSTEAAYIDNHERDMACCPEIRNARIASKI